MWKWVNFLLHFCGSDKSRKINNKLNYNNNFDKIFFDIFIKIICMISSHGLVQGFHPLSPLTKKYNSCIPLFLRGKGRVGKGKAVVFKLEVVTLLSSVSQPGFLGTLGFRGHLQMVPQNLCLSFVQCILYSFGLLTWSAIEPVKF